MKIGWIGTGIMGRSMAGHLLRGGHEVAVFNRTRARAESLIQAGATWRASPADAARNAEVVFTMVGFPPDVEAVYFGLDGLLAEAAPGRVLVDMTTTRPALAHRIAETAARSGMAALDAPVSGGDVGAREATLAIMAGGDPEAYAKVLPLFRLLGKNIALMGGPGAGQHTKMSNQILIAGTMIGVCECLLYAVKQGLDPAALIDIIGQGAAASWSINNLGRRIVKGDFEPGFYVEHFIKDLGIALEEAAAARLPLPGLALAHQLYVGLQAQGHGRKGTQALYLALKTLAGM